MPQLKTASDFQNDKDWAADPVGLFELINSKRTRFIFDGYQHNRFPIEIPYVEQSINRIKELMDDKNDDYILKGSPELTEQLAEEIRLITEEAERLQRGKQIFKPDLSDHRIVKYPYRDTLMLSLRYTLIAEQVARYNFYKKLLTELEDKQDPRIAKDITELMAILKEDNPIASKLDKLIEWDKQYTKKELLRAHKPVDVFHVNKAMNLPGYYQRQYKQLCVEDLIESDCATDAIVVPSFMPVDIYFFNAARKAPVYLIGLLDFPFLYADGYKHTANEFAYHDLKHAWDMEVFRLKVMAERSTSLQDTMYEQARNAEFIFGKVEKIENPNVRDCISLLLFELVHEEGHSYDLDDMLDGLSDESIYCNDLLARLATQKVGTNFFGGANVDYHKAIPHYQAAKEALITIIGQARKEFEIPERKASIATNQHGFCEIRHGEKVQKRISKPEAENLEQGERLLTPNITVTKKA